MAWRRKAYVTSCLLVPVDINLKETIRAYLSPIVQVDKSSKEDVGVVTSYPLGGLGIKVNPLSYVERLSS